MNKKQTGPTQDDAILAQLLGSPDKEPPNGEEDVARMQRELIGIFLERARREETERQAAEERARAARLAGAKAREEAAARERAVQASCPHQKPFGGPSIAAQRDHQQNILWICLYCGKTWVNNEIPMHLRIPGEEIGGPLI